MAEDVRALLDHLDIARADVMGYSMGARITAFLALAHPAAGALRRCSAGSASIWSTASGLPESIAEALEAPSLADVTDPTGRHVPRLRRADQIRPAALAACIRGSRQTLTRAAGRPRSQCRCWSRSAPRTTSPARPQELAALIPGAQRARYSRPRPHAGGRRQGLQGRRARIP